MVDLTLHFSGVLSLRLVRVVAIECLRLWSLLVFSLVFGTTDDLLDMMADDVLQLFVDLDLIV